MNSAALKTVLECPVCFQVPRSKIFVCSNSHKICESCYGKITAGAKQCPQGNCLYDEPPRRSRELEEIVENADLELSCSNASAGCKVDMKKDELRKHEMKCIFRQVPCPYTHCKKLISFNCIDSHISQSHLATTKKENPVCRPASAIIIMLDSEVMEKENADWVLSEWKTDGGKVFYPQFLKKGGFWYFWIQAKADPATSASYEVTTVVQNPDGVKLTFTGPVHPIDLSVEEIMKTGYYIMMNRQQVEKMKFARDQEQMDPLLQLNFAIRNVNNLEKENEVDELIEVLEGVVGGSGNAKKKKAKTNKRQV